MSLYNVCLFYTLILYVLDHFARIKWIAMDKNGVVFQHWITPLSTSKGSEGHVFICLEVNMDTGTDKI